MGQFGTGFMDVIHFLYPSAPIESWCNMIGRIVGVVVIYGIWQWLGRGLVRLGAWVIA
jgi:hypothetical protein